MPRRCALSGKSVQYGNNVSHANNKTKRRFMSNLQVASVLSDALGHSVRLRLTPRGIKTIEHNGGIDAYLLGTNDSKLTPEMLTLKRRVTSAKAKKDAKKAVAVALRNRYRRGLLNEKLREEIIPKNILMIGPTGVGKTEIARRIGLVFRTSHN